MRRWIWAFSALVFVGLVVAVYLLKPVAGPERDLTLTANAEHGAYMVTVAGCVACHTDIKNDAPRLSGGAALKTPFGDFVPPNITPHPEAGIGGMSLAAFSNAMSNGKGEGFFNHLYPAFPYDNYTLVSDQDIVDMYAALMAETPVAEPAPGHRVAFPFNIRLGMLAWKNLFLNPRRYEVDPSKSDVWNRGAYLANGPAHCSACHTPRNIFGAQDYAQAFEGGDGTPGDNVPAITAAALLAAEYDQTTLIEALQTGFTPGFDVLGGTMGEVIEFSTSLWTDEDLEAIAVYLLDAG